jgi:molybdenum cofactor biosynthesis enzyme MoaA
MKKTYICNRCGKEVEDVTFCDECKQYVCTDCTQVDSSVGGYCKDCFTDEELANLPDLTPEEIKDIEDSLARGESI